MISIVVFTLIVLVCLYYYLRGDDLSAYDRAFPVFAAPDPNSEGMKNVESFLIDNFIRPAASPGTRQEKLQAKRALFEKLGTDRQFDGTFLADTIVHDDHTIDGEWTLIEGHDPTKRILYIHGGGFTVGSAKSHRALTYNLAQRTGAAVFAPNYRLMPEHPRMASIQDSQRAYQWIWENGPQGPSKAQNVAIGGDSAGGNLALMLSGWIKAQNLKPASAVFALSPLTDNSYMSPSIRSNLDTDLMLKPLVTPLTKMPQWQLLFLTALVLRMRPANPLLSPVRADLSNLPPTLLQASRIECVYDDAVRYAAKAQDARSPVQIQIWDNVCHVWQIFDDRLPAARDALDEIGHFLNKNMV